MANDGNTSIKDIELQVVVDRLSQGGWTVTGGRLTDVGPQTRVRLGSPVLTSETDGRHLLLALEQGPVKLPEARAVQRDDWWMQVLCIFPVVEQKKGGGRHTVGRAQPALTLVNYGMQREAALRRREERLAQMQRQLEDDAARLEMLRNEFLGTMNALYGGSRISHFTVTSAGRLVIHLSDHREFEVGLSPRSDVHRTALAVNGYRLNTFTRIDQEQKEDDQ